MFQSSQSYDSSYSKSYDAGLRQYMLKIYNYIAIALAITGVAAYASIATPLASLFYNVVGSQIVGINTLGYIMMFSPLAIGLYFSFGFGSMSLEKAKTLFWIYSACMGVSLSSLALIYTGVSIVKTFFICSAAFGGMSLYGYTTNKDLTAFSTTLTIGVVGLLIAGIINVFLRSPALYFATSLIGVGIFMGLIAYDTQKIKNVYYSTGGGSVAQKFAIMSAFQLYLDFINLFVYMLRLTGDRKE